MLLDGLIAAHAASGVIAFVTGCIAIRRRSAFVVYLTALVAMVAFLDAALAVDWPGLEGLSRALYCALAVLGGYLVWRAVQAHHLLVPDRSPRAARYLDHVGFTLVALFDGFAIVAVITAGGPGWLAGAVGVLGVGVGHVTIGRLKRHLVAGTGLLGAAVDPARRLDGLDLTCPPPSSPDGP